MKTKLFSTLIGANPYFYMFYYFTNHLTIPRNYALDWINSNMYENEVNGNVGTFTQFLC